MFSVCLFQLESVEYVALVVALVFEPAVTLKDCAIMED